MAAEQTARLERIAERGPTTRSLFLRPATPLAFEPGQFLSFKLPVGGSVLTRPYSIASDPEAADLLEVVIDLVPGGPGSTHLFSLAPGAGITYTGPWGGFTLSEAPRVEVVFIADGTGIAPIRPMLRRALATAVRPVTLHYARPLGAPFLFATELVAPHPGYTFHDVASDDLVARIEHCYVRKAADRAREFYVCGVGPVVHALRDLLRGGGYERRAVRYERW